MRVVPLLAVIAAAATAVPASAAIHPVCATRLVDAATGASAYCPTQGPPPLGNRNVALRRTMTIEVAAGAVDATLDCDNRTPLTTRVSGPVAQSLNMWGGYDCTATVVAVVDHTTAVATSTFSYVIVLD